MTPAQFEARVQALVSGGLERELLQEAIATGAMAERQAKLNATERLRVRTGYLRGSIAGGGEIRAGSIVTFLRAGGGAKDVRYAKAQELGAHLVPGPGKRFLAIPTGPALTGAGVPRYASPRDVAGLRFQAILGGRKGLLVKDIPGRSKSGRGSRSEIWYYLVRQATIKPKYYLIDGLLAARDGMRDRVTQRLRRRLGASA